MKLLFDHNLSHRLVPRLADIFADSTQTGLLGFNRAADTVIWEHARANGFVVVTLDKDFADLSFIRGAPPKVIWLRCGNSTVAEVEHLLRLNLQAILEFEAKQDSNLLEIWP
jgi:predicted nuclease of predicted toxin-antitoxin system